MMTEDFRLDPLWLKLNFMNMNAAASMQPFLQLIAQQTGWPLATINTVMEEYRKFLFLAMRAGHPVAPPSMIEQMWTLHMHNAQNYWEALGRMVTERPVAPGFGPMTATTLAEQYQQTLASYQRIFGAAPPMDIWGQGPAKADPFSTFTDAFKRMFGLNNSGY